MKRFIAVLLTILLCLTLLVPMSMAAPEEEPMEEEAPVEELPEISEEDLEEPEEDPLAGETAIRHAKITVVVDREGRAAVTQELQVSVVGILDELRFAVPENAKNRELQGWRAKNHTEEGRRYLVVKNDTGFTGEQTFTLTYTQDGLVTEGVESHILDLPLLVGQDYRVGGVALAVNLPKNFASYPMFSSSYRGEIIEDHMEYTTVETAVSGMVNTILQDSDTLSMSLTLPDKYFSGSFSTGGAATVTSILSAVLLALVLLFWWRTLRNPSLRVQPRTLPPDGVNPGDLPFLLSGGHADFNMLVSYWATLGYLSFYVNKSGHVILRRRMDMGNERRAFERKLFDQLFGNNTMCDGASTRYKKVGERAMAVIPRYWGKRLFDRRSGSPYLARAICCLACGFATVAAMDNLAPLKLHGLFLFLSFIAGAALAWLLVRVFGAWNCSDWLWMGLGAGSGVLLLVLGGLGGAVYIMLPAVAITAFLGWQTTHGGRRSAYGTEVISQTMGFRKFLLHISENHVQQMLRRDSQYFYKMLPYAEAMGLGRRFVTMCHSVKLEPCQWYESARSVPLNASAFYDHYLDSLDMLNISIGK